MSDSTFPQSLLSDFDIDRMSALHDEISLYQAKMAPLINEISQIKAKEKMLQEEKIKKVYIIAGDHIRIVAAYDTLEETKLAHSLMCNSNLYKITEVRVNAKTPEDVRQEYFDPF